MSAQHACTTSCASRSAFGGSAWNMNREPVALVALLSTGAVRELTPCSALLNTSMYGAQRVRVDTQVKIVNASVCVLWARCSLRTHIGKVERGVDSVPVHSVHHQVRILAPPGGHPHQLDGQRRQQLPPSTAPPPRASLSMKLMIATPRRCTLPRVGSSPNNHLAPK